MLLRAVVLLAAAAAACGQSESSKRIDDIFQEWNKPNTPGAAVAVIRDGAVIFQRGYGSANLEYAIPISPETVFHVASVSKQFTAMALVLLERDGKLSLDDAAAKYLPELGAYGRKITIRNLLQHTSGIRDQWQTLALAGWRLDDVITQKQILRMLFHQKELNFPPGTEHLYSNGGYTLAAEIVKRVSGQALPAFCAEHIFRPLGMSKTHFHDDLKMIVPNRAYSYSRAGDGFENSPLNYANVGATSLFTTAPDLVRWLDNFRDPKVGGRAAVDRLQEQAVLESGRKIDYALGVSTGQYRGHRTVSHGGGDAAFRSYVLWFPDERLGIAVLSNLGNFNPGQVANRVADVFLGTSPEPEPAKVERKFIQVDASALDRFTGLYRLTPGLLIEVQKKGGVLLASPPGEPPAELKPLAANRFYVEAASAELEFTTGADGKPALMLRQAGAEIPGERVVSVPFDSADLPNYAGVYWSEELETQYTVRSVNGKLVADHKRHGEIELTPIRRDRFRGNSWFFSEARFTRDPSGRIDGMAVGSGRVRSVRFVRR